MFNFKTAYVVGDIQIFKTMKVQYVSIQKAFRK